MSGNKQILLGMATRLWFRAPEGVPSACTITIKDRFNEDLDTAIDGAAATIESVSLAVDADSGNTSDSTQDPKILYLASTTGLTKIDPSNRVDVDKRYMLTNGEDPPEWVRIRHIESNAHVVLTEPLQYFYESGAGTLKSTWCYYDLATDILDDEDNHLKKNYQVLWEYTVNSQAYKHMELYDCDPCRTDVDMVSRSMILRNNPILIKKEPAGLEGLAFIDQRIEARENTYEEIRKWGKDPAYCMQLPAFEKAAWNEFMLILARSGLYVPGPHRDNVEEYIKIITRARDNAFNNAMGQKIWWDDNRDGVQNTGVGVEEAKPQLFMFGK